MRKFISFIIAFSIVINTLPSIAIAQEQRPTTKGYLIGYKNIEGKNKIDSKGKIKHQFKHSNTVLVELDKVTKEALANDPDIEYIEPDALVQSETETTNEQASWGYSIVGTDSVHQQGYFGQGVKVAVLDSGVDLTHPDLQTEPGFSFVGDTYQDDNGHGTQVTGIINAQLNDLGVRGISPSAKIYPIKVLDQNGQGNYSSVIKGIEWAIDNNVDIVSMSFGGDIASKTLENTVNLAAKNGILLIASAGNTSSLDNNILYPARYDSVIAVGSVNQSGKISSFSKNGPELELLAPGEGILTTQLGGTYINSSGTSIATAFVAGAAALVKGANPNLDNNEIRNLLQKSSKSISEDSQNIINIGNAIFSEQAQINTGEQAPPYVTQPVQDQALPEMLSVVIDIISRIQKFSEATKEELAIICDFLNINAEILMAFEDKGYSKYASINMAIMVREYELTVEEVERIKELYPKMIRAVDELDRYKEFNSNKKLQVKYKNQIKQLLLKGIQCPR